MQDHIDTCWTHKEETVRTVVTNEHPSQKTGTCIELDKI